MFLFTFSSNDLFRKYYQHNHEEAISSLLGDSDIMSYLIDCMR